MSKYLSASLEFSSSDCYPNITAIIATTMITAIVITTITITIIFLQLHKRGSHWFGNVPRTQPEMGIQEH